MSLVREKTILKQAFDLPSKLNSEFLYNCLNTFCHQLANSTELDSNHKICSSNHIKYEQSNKCYSDCKYSMKRKKQDPLFFFSRTNCLQVELCGNAAIEIGYNTIFCMKKNDLVQSKVIALIR